MAGGTDGASKGGGTRKRREDAPEEPESTPTGNAVAQATKAVEIYNAWRKGRDVTSLAQEYGLGERRTRKIVSDLRRASIEGQAIRHPLHALTYVEELIVRLEAAENDAADLFGKAVTDSNWSVALGCLKRGADARQELLDVKQRCQIVPKNLGMLPGQADWVAMGEEAIDYLLDHGVPEETVQGYLDVLELRTRRDSEGALRLDTGDEREEVVDGEVVEE